MYWFNIYFKCDCGSEGSEAPGQLWLHMYLTSTCKWVKGFNVKALWALKRKKNQGGVNLSKNGHKAVSLATTVGRGGKVGQQPGQSLVGTEHV